MRADMHKLIVERPRGGSRFFRNKKTALRMSPHRVAAAVDEGEDHDDGPRRAPSSRHAKWLNENLAPLARYLRTQVGRPWDKVYSEIRAGIDTRSALGLHVMQHLYAFVAVHALRRDRVVYSQWRGRLYPVDGLFVDPDSGLLRYQETPRRPRMGPRPAVEPWVADRDQPAHAPRVFRKVGGAWYSFDYRREADGELVLVSKYQCDKRTVQLIEDGAFGRLVIS
ncbi:MAG: hypothetical protein R2729_28765 [Bryobacteraceae bacterium]